MNAENRSITSSQMMILVIGFLQGSVLVLSFMDSIIAQDAWIIVLGAMALSIPLILSYMTLAKWHPGKSLIEINDIVFGKYLGKLFSALYIIYLLMLFTFNLRDLSDFYTSFIMIETPKIVFAAAFVLVSAYAIKKGIYVLAKVSLFAVLFMFASILVNTILLADKLDPLNFLPMMELPASTYAKATTHFMIVPYCELAVFLFAAPTVSDIGKLSRKAIAGMCLAALSFFIIEARNTAVLGIATQEIDMVSYQSARLIDIGEFFTRVELLIGLGFTMSLFIKVSVIYYATVRSVADLFHLRDRSSLILPLGGIVVILSLITYRSTVSHFEFALKYNVHLIALFEFILPPFTLLIAKIRRSAKLAIQKYAGGAS